MKAKGMVGMAVLALGLAAAVVLAQDRPSEPPRGGGDDRQAPREMQDVDGLDMLLAADPDPDAAQGPGGTMGPPAGPGMRGMGRGRAELQKQLKLTDDQKTKLADIRDRSARAAIPIRGDLEVASLDMRKLMRADKPDSRAIDAQIDKIAGLRAKLQKSRVANMLEARNVLTPDQQKILRDARPGMMGPGMRRRMQGMHGMHGDPGMGMGMEGGGTGTHL